MDTWTYRKNGKISLNDIFVGKNYALKIFCRVDVLRKYFNTKILQHRSREKHSERVTAMEKFFKRNCIHSYHVHVYKKVWAATAGEVLVCEREPKNSSDRYAVAVKNEGTIIEHLPRKLSWVCSLFRCFQSIMIILYSMAVNLILSYGTITIATSF